MIAQQPCDSLNNIPPESASQSSDPRNMLLYMTKGIFKIEDFEMMITLDYPGGPNNVITNILVKGRQKRRWCDDRSRDWSDVLWRWRKGHKPGTIGGPWKLGKGKEMDPSLRTSEGPSSADTLSLAKWDWIWASELQNYKKINLCFFKALSLW